MLRLVFRHRRGVRRVAFRFALRFWSRFRGMTFRLVLDHHHRWRPGIRRMTRGLALRRGARFRRPLRPVADQLVARQQRRPRHRWRLRCTTVPAGWRVVGPFLVVPALAVKGAGTGRMAAHGRTISRASYQHHEAASSQDQCRPAHEETMQRILRFATNDSAFRSNFC